VSIFSSRKNLYVVLCWNDANHHVPVVYGPYKNNDTALKVRNRIRREQGREKQMAQVVPVQ
jgi:hypothetical protein